MARFFLVAILTLFCAVQMLCALPANNIKTSVALADNIKTSVIAKRYEEEQEAEEEDEEEEEANGLDLDLGVDLDELVRGLFDKVVDYVIEVTPLNDIVHGNYDLLYDIFTDLVQDVIKNATAQFQPPITLA